FHMSGADLANRDDRGTFQVIAETYGLAERDPVLVELGEVVRAADAIHSKVAFRGVPMSEAAPPGGPPESPGLQALLHGSRLAGWPGSAVATLAYILPSAVVMAVLAAGYLAATSLPAIGPAVMGLTAAVVGVLLATTYRIGKRAIDLKQPITILIALLAFIA